jgi:Holliday junction resolvase
VKIDPAIADRHWEQAAVEQLCHDLQEQGYAVEREVAFGKLRADLVATGRDGTVTLFEVKVPSRGRTPGWAHQAVALRAQARALGGRFKLVLVRPPRDVAVEIDGLEAALLDALTRTPPAELASLESGARVEAVDAVYLDEVKMHGQTVEVAGEGSLVVDLLESDGGSFLQEDFPFSFRAVFDETNQVASLSDVSVDLSSWGLDHGGLPAPRGSPETEGKQPLDP